MSFNPSILLKNCYGISHIQHIVELSSGLCSSHWDIDTDKGRFFIKRFDPKVGLERALRSCHIQNYLAKQIIAPKILSTLSGEYLCIFESGLYSISNFLQSETPKPITKPDTASRLGSILGRLHRALFDLDEGLLKTSFLKWPSTFELNVHKALRESNDKRVVYELTQRLAWIKNIDRRVMDNCSPQWVHGDYWYNNVLAIENDPFSYVIDFDQASWFIPHYEIARGFFASISTDYCPRSIELLFKKYITGYLKETPLPKDHLSFVYDVFVLVSASNITDYFANCHDALSRRAYAHTNFKRLEFVIKNESVFRRILQAI